jgi:hypothetical protein
MTREEWRLIPGMDGHYEVSSLGRVRSLPRIVRNGRHLNRCRGKILRPFPPNKGYPKLYLGADRNVYVAHLVLEAFVGPRPSGLVAKYADGDPANIALSNLRWAQR